ncbi:DUF3147 family protein [Alloacidobacterium dinghuense]|uniref:DUF3147 family protein n=1 Tax=Alloacidobacterium dinghuense TaxID=2763107 RepID=A0A7G8BLD0_9BACT|nr:DUF3147 family protein [Alloacidobacterium dinghuense]QNI33350.1 DUF3147 family protein [Alloacidobacterium dinghuense]
MVDIKFSALRDTKPHEYFMRFLFGGLVTAAAGLIATRFGPAIGGLFLAFPAIFPASATLIATHEKRRKAAIGHNGANRGRMAASIDSAGAALGCIGLFGFALVVWRMLPAHNPIMVIATASAVWTLLACASWELRKRRIFAHRTRR